jgi:hypothetical protein
MPNLSAVLSPSDLTWAELQAARLDGDVYELAGAYCLIGELESPRHRAHAVLAGRSPRLIAELATAAWIWGAAPEPPRPTFAVTPHARTRLAPDRRTTVREIVYADGDLEQLGTVRVTAPLRTALDLARAAEFDADSAGTVARLAAIAGFDLADCLAALARRPGIPCRKRAEVRLTRALAPSDGQAVETR